MRVIFTLCWVDDFEDIDPRTSDAGEISNNNHRRIILDKNITYFYISWYFSTQSNNLSNYYKSVNKDLVGYKWAKYKKVKLIIVDLNFIFRIFYNKNEIA